MRIERYADSRKAPWDEFVRASKNGTFLFLRNYMDYHADRFRDHSFLIWQDDKLIALLPANEQEKMLISHAGLTYGGLLIDNNMRLPLMGEVFDEILKDLAARRFNRFVYKTIPHIYHKVPAEEDRYWLFRNRAALYRADVLTVIDYSHALNYQERRLRSLKKAKQNKLTIRLTTDYAQFWEILAENLRTRYELKPVHSLDEIKLLAARFPEQIRLYGAYEDETMHAGAVVYLSENVCHVQYNAAGARGKELGTQDLLMDYLVETHRHSHRYFDFGVSSENEGQHLNVGLVDYKEGFGARTIVHDFFMLDLRST